MKTLFVLVAFLAGLFWCVAPQPRRIAPSQHDEFRTERLFGAASENDFPYANRIDPERYLEIYRTLQKMPVGDKIERLKTKGIRSTSTSLSSWESFGPLGAPSKLDLTGNQDFGRIRTMTWYWNSGMSQWERFIGAGSGGIYVAQPLFTAVLWQSIGDGLPNPSVGAIAVDPNNPNTILVGTGDWSRDNGAGIFKTTDRGVHWNYFTSIGDWVTGIYFLGNSSTIIASSWAGVFRTTDAGANWTHCSLDPATTYASCYKLVIVNSSKIYAALNYGRGIYTSNDGGGSWSKVSNGLPATSGKTVALDASISNPEVLYCAYADTNNNFGGIYRTSNAGASWARVTDPPTYMYNGQGHHANVIRIHPNNPNIVYAGSVGFVKSTDGGASWTTPEAGHADHTGIEFDPNDPNNIYLCSDGGIILRNDAANTINNANYKFLPGAPLQVYEMDYAWSKPEEIVSGTQDNGEIFTPGGSHPGDQWMEIAGCDGGTQLSIHPSNPDLIVGNEWCGSYSPRWRTTDGGMTFDSINNGLPPGTYIPIQYAKGGSTLLFTCSLTGLYNSYNNGDVWLSSTVNAGNDFAGGFPWVPILKVNHYATIGNKVCYVVWGNYNYIIQGSPGAMTVSQPIYNFTHLIPDRGDRDEVFGTMNGYIFKSTNRGQTWTDISGSGFDRIPYGLPINDVLEIAAGGAIYAATSLGVMKSNDGGAHWFRFQDGLPIVSVVRIERSFGLTYDTLRIATYGRGFWQRLINDAPPGGLLASQPINGAILGLGGKNSGIHGVGRHGAIVNSTNGGATWDTIPPPVPNDLHSIALLTDQNILAGGDAGALIKSTDGGATWTPLPIPSGGSITGLTVTPSGIVWGCSDDGMMMKSTNGGVDWIPQFTPAGMSFRSCQFVTDGFGAAAGQKSIVGGGSSPMVYITTNGGDLWTPSPPSPAGSINKLFFMSDSEGFVVGDNGALFKTTDGGSSWNPQASGTSRSLRDVLFTDQMTGYACGDSGTLRKTDDGGQSWYDFSNGITNNLFVLGFMPSRLIVGGDAFLFSSSQVHQNTIHYSLANNWNLVSLPVSAADTSVAGIFPSHASNAFSYDGSGYAVAPVMTPGAGYWLRFSGDQVAEVTGTPNPSFAIPVNAGWNLIGGGSQFFHTSDIVSIPAGIITSQFFGYAGSYQTATTLEPGQAYWVKANQAGTLYLTTSPAMTPGAAGRIRIETSAEMPPPPPDVKPAAAQLPVAFALDQNYPNPFNPSTTLRYALAGDARVTVKVFDILGREIATLVSRNERAGFKSISWNASSVASGIYICRIEADPLDGTARFIATRKMVLLR